MSRLRSNRYTCCAAYDDDGGAGRSYARSMSIAAPVACSPSHGG